MGKLAGVWGADWILIRKTCGGGAGTLEPAVVHARKHGHTFLPERSWPEISTKSATPPDTAFAGMFTPPPSTSARESVAAASALCVCVRVQYRGIRWAHAHAHALAFITAEGSAAGAQRRADPYGGWRRQRCCVRAAPRSGQAPMRSTPMCGRTRGQGEAFRFRNPLLCLQYARLLRVGIAVMICEKAFRRAWEYSISGCAGPVARQTYVCHVLPPHRSLSPALEKHAFPTSRHTIQSHTVARVHSAVVAQGTCPRTATRSRGSNLYHGGEPHSQQRLAHRFSEPPAPRVALCGYDHVHLRCNMMRKIAPHFPCQRGLWWSPLWRSW